MLSHSRSIAAASLFVLLAGAHVASAQTHKTTEPPARRGRWGGAIGVRTMHGVAVYDFRDTSTPFAHTTGPYTVDTITIDHKWLGKYFSGGYRGPFTRGGRLGFGLEAQLSGMGEDLPSTEVIGTSSTGVPVRFSTLFNIVDLITVSGEGHVSYNVARPLNVWAGAKVSSQRIKFDQGAYQLVSAPNSPLAYLDVEAEHPDFWVRLFVPTIGAEVFLFKHGSFEASEDFLPSRIDRPPTPASLATFQRRRTSLTAAFRIFF